MLPVRFVKSTLQVKNTVCVTEAKVYVRRLISVKHSSLHKSIEFLRRETFSVYAHHRHDHSHV
jgi:hypothetical protein